MSTFLYTARARGRPRTAGGSSSPGSCWPAVGLRPLRRRRRPAGQRLHDSPAPSPSAASTRWPAVPAGVRDHRPDRLHVDLRTDHRPAGRDRGPDQGHREGQARQQRRRPVRLRRGRHDLDGQAVRPVARSSSTWRRPTCRRTAITEVEKAAKPPPPGPRFTVTLGGDMYTAAGAGIGITDIIGVVRRVRRAGDHLRLAARGRSAAADRRSRGGHHPGRRSSRSRGSRPSRRRRPPWR